MKNIKLMLATLFAVALGSFAVQAADTTDAKPKADTMTTCPVSGEKLGEMGKPFTFVKDGQEVKLCCKNCKKDFDKEPAKYIEKIQDAEKAAKN